MDHGPHRHRDHHHEVLKVIRLLLCIAIAIALCCLTAQQVADAALIQTLFAVLAPIATDRTYSSENTWSEDFWSLVV